MAFTFSDQYVTLPSTAMPSTFTGGFTAIIITQRAAAVGTPYAWKHLDISAAVTRWSMGFSADAFFINHPATGYPAGGFAQATTTAPVGEGWVAVAFTHPGGVASAGRFHKYVFSTGAWTHEVGTGGTVQSLLGDPSGSFLVGRFASGSAGNAANGDYAVMTIYPSELTDATLENMMTTSSLLSRGNVSSILFDGATVIDLASGATPSAITATASSVSVPLTYNATILIPLTEATGGGSGTATLTADGVLTSTGSGSVTPPTPTPAVPVGTGWTLLSVSPANVATEVKFTNTGQFTHDQSRPVRRAISGFSLLPSEAEKVDLARDSVRAYLRVDDQSYPMGIFYFTESSRQKDAIKDDDGNPSDLIHVSLSDQFIRLQRSDEVPRFALAGADPSQEMIRYLSETDIPHSITGAANPISEDVVWQPFTTYETIVSQLAELAGHRRPWADNYGVIRSVSARVVDSEVIPLEDLKPIDGTIVITDNYLSAPNRVVVYDDQGEYPVVGVWDAPSTAPNSAATRGWVQTAGVQAQGLSGVVHAQQMAQTIGEQMAARRLAGDIIPTNRLDGPVVLSYDGALWLVNGWSVSTAVGSTMSFDASELILPPNQGTLRA